MLNRKPKDPSSLDLAIEALIKELDTVTGDSKEYTKMTDNLTKLSAVKTSESSEKVNINTALIVAGNLLGVTMILAHEHIGVVTSKALNLILKPRA